MVCNTIGLHDIKYTSSLGSALEIYGLLMLCVLDGNWAVDTEWRVMDREQMNWDWQLSARGEGGSCQGTAAGVLGPDGTVIRGH